MDTHLSVLQKMLVVVLVLARSWGQAPFKERELKSAFLSNWYRRLPACFSLLCQRFTHCCRYIHIALVKQKNKT